MKAKKSLGQNFLINEGVINKITSLLNCNKDDLIVEIGPGRGALTKQLCKLDSQFLAIEVDQDMKEYLEPLNINVIYEDILSCDLLSVLSNYKYKRLFIIGNLPYYITSPILEKLIYLNIKIDKMIFMVQKEVAIRYCANPGSRDFGVMSLFLQFGYWVKKEFDVGKGNFNPIPKVDSSIISLVPNNNNYSINFKDYVSFLKKAFLMKRKTLKNNLKEYDWSKIKVILSDCGISKDVRAEDLSQDIFIKIYKSLKE